jgi:hypothetical protein
MDPDVAPVCIIDVDQSSAEFRHNPERWAPRWPGRPAMGTSEDDGDHHLER